MKNRNPASNIDFADSSFKSFEMSDEYDLILHMKNWQELPLRVIFKNTIRFFYSDGSFPEDLYIVNETSEFLENAIKKEYGVIPKEHPFKLFHLVDIEDCPFIQIVAESVTVVKVEN